MLIEAIRRSFIAFILADDIFQKKAYLILDRDDHFR